MPSGNSFSIPRHPQLIFLLATWFHNKRKQFVSMYSLLTSPWPYSLVPRPSGCNVWAAILLCISNSNRHIIATPLPECAVALRVWAISVKKCKLSTNLLLFCCWMSFLFQANNEYSAKKTQHARLGCQTLWHTIYISKLSIIYLIVYLYIFLIIGDV